MPGVKVKIPVVGERDIKDIEEWAVPNDVFFIALSFVQSPDDVKACRSYCKGKPVKIISKIKNIEGLKNFDGILAESDGIMVSPKDLRVGTSMDMAWTTERTMIEKTQAAGKYVVRSTEMVWLENRTFPTPAEALEVSLSVFLGSSAVMLRSEVDMGDFLVRRVDAMRHIICEVTEHTNLARRARSRSSRSAPYVHFAWRNFVPRTPV